MNPAVVRRFATRFAALDWAAGLNSALGVLLAERSWPSSFFPSSAMLNGDLVERGRQGMRWGDAWMQWVRRDELMAPWESKKRRLSSKCQSVRLRSCCASSPL